MANEETTTRPEETARAEAAKPHPHFGPDSNGCRGFDRKFPDGLATLTPAETACQIAKKASEMKEMREAYWKECDPAQKCERLRQKLHQQANRIEVLEAMTRELMRHQHLADGKMVTPLEGALEIDLRSLRNRVNIAGGPGLREDVWI